MSRIGNTPVTIPDSVTVTVSDDSVIVKGPKGELQTPRFKGIQVKVEDSQVVFERENDQKQTKAFHGLQRSLIQNNVDGVTQGYKKTLKLFGTGYRVQAKGKGLSLAVGYSHPVEFDPPEGVSLKVEGNDTIYVEGFDKQLVGQVSANIRKIKPPDAYKGKGIRFEDEVVRLKPGKTAA